MHDPQAERDEFDRRYAELDDTYAPMEVHAVPKTERQLWDQLVGNLDGKRILECGAGTGRLTVWLACQGAHVAAIELSSVGCLRTKERARFNRVGSRVDVICSDVLRAPNFLEPGSIDLAIGKAILHHLPARDFGTALRIVLKPGGSALFLENSDRNPLYRFARRVRNGESPNGCPLNAKRVQPFLLAIGEGELIFPRFGLFRHIRKYVFQNNQLFANLVEGVDTLIDRVPGTRPWSSHMWVFARRVN